MAPFGTDPKFVAAPRCVRCQGGADIPIGPSACRDVIGAIGFGGANGAQGGGNHDEACAKAGLDKIKARVK
jgi:uncharacterized protein GlcG (DUF336 family)